MISLTDVSDEALVGRLVEIRKHERSLLVELLRYLAELDRRRTVLAQGFPSLFSFCTEFLGLTKASTFRRTTAARLLARFPLVADYLADGRLNLTTLVELRDVVDEADLVEILDRAAGRTEEQVKVLVAALRPQPAPDLLRRLPTPRNHCGGSGPALAANNNAHPAPTPVAAPPPPPTRPVAATLQPIAPERHVLRVTVSSAFVADLEAVRQAFSHKLPAGGLEEVLHECLRVTLQSIERRRRGAGKKTSAKAPPPGSRHVPVVVRDQVWQRDDGQCAFVGTNGRRCGSRHQVQLHHLDPFGKGGPATAANLSLRCRAHNLHAAEQDYGREHIDRKIAASRRRNHRPGTEAKAVDARYPTAASVSSVVRSDPQYRVGRTRTYRLGDVMNRARETSLLTCRRSLVAGMAAVPVLSHVAGCANVLSGFEGAKGSGFDADSLKEQVDRDQVNWAVQTDHFAISEPVARPYPPATLLVQGSLQAINLGGEMSPYTKLEDLRWFAEENHIELVGNAPTVWLYQWVSRAQGPMVFETGFVVQKGSQCPNNAHGYRIKHLAAVKVSSIVYRGPYPNEPSSGWSQIRWAERAKEKGFEYTEKLYRELYFREGGKAPKRPRITVIEISIA